MNEADTPRRRRGGERKRLYPCRAAVAITEDDERAIQAAIDATGEPRGEVLRWALRRGVAAVRESARKRRRHLDKLGERQ